MTWPRQKVCTLTAQLLASDENWCLRILVCFSWSVEMDSISKWISTILEEHRQVWEFQLSSAPPFITPPKSRRTFPPKKTSTWWESSGREDPVDHASFIASGIGVHANLAWRCGVFQRKRWISKRQISMRVMWWRVMWSWILGLLGCDSFAKQWVSWKILPKQSVFTMSWDWLKDKTNHISRWEWLSSACFGRWKINWRWCTETNLKQCGVWKMYFWKFSPLSELLHFFVPKRRNGCFRKSGYRQIIHFNRVFHYKPFILGYPYYWKHPNNDVFFVQLLSRCIFLRERIPKSCWKSGVFRQSTIVITVYPFFFRWYYMNLHVTYLISTLYT